MGIKPRMAKWIGGERRKGKRNTKTGRICCRDYDAISAIRSGHFDLASGRVRPPRHPRRCIRTGAKSPPAIILTHTAF